MVFITIMPVQLPVISDWTMAHRREISQGRNTATPKCTLAASAGSLSIPRTCGKVALEEPPGNRPVDDEMVKKARARLFGSWEMNWMAYNFASDVALPGSAEAPVQFLIYPQAETAERPAGQPGTGHLQVRNHVEGDRGPRTEQTGSAKLRNPMSRR